MLQSLLSKNLDNDIAGKQEQGKLIQLWGIVLNQGLILIIVLFLQEAIRAL